MAVRYIPEGEDFSFPRDSMMPSAEAGGAESELIKIGKLNHNRVGMSGLGNAAQRRTSLPKSIPAAAMSVAAKPRKQVDRVRVSSFSKGGRAK